MVPPGGTPWGTVSRTLLPFGARAMMVTPGRAFRGTRTSKVAPPAARPLIEAPAPAGANPLAPVWTCVEIKFQAPESARRPALAKTLLSLP